MTAPRQSGYNDAVALGLMLWLEPARIATQAAISR